MSFCLSFHLALLGPSGAHWLDDPPDLSCQDSPCQYAVDDSRLSCINCGPRACSRIAVEVGSRSRGAVEAGHEPAIRTHQR